SNKDGIGAQVVIQAGGKTQLREQNGKSHYGAQDDITMHFGLLGSTMVDKISIHWPSGTTQNLQDIKADQTLHIVESSAENQQ
ncbi:ASPIC/UnbV domain-containing protein, partial [Thiolapillus sp.]